MPGPDPPPQERIPSDCIFCQIVAEDAPASFLHRDDLVTAFLDIRPVTLGHALVIPNQHLVHTYDLPDATADRLFAVARGLARRLRSAHGIGADGINLLTADGEAAGQEVSHAHLHVIPRFPADGFAIDAAAWREPQPSRAELDAWAARIRTSLGDTPTGRETEQEKPENVFPELRLETPRLLLRPYRAEDAADVARACRDELTQQWLPLPNPYTDAHALAWCTEFAPRVRTSGEGVELAAARRVDDRLVGSFGLKRTDWRARTSEIGYWVAPWARGQGLAVEVTLALARWLLLEQGFERLVLRAASGNVASLRVAEKAGFVREGVARNAGFTNAGRVDLVVFSLIPSDLTPVA